MAPVLGRTWPEDGAMDGTGSREDADSYNYPHFDGYAAGGFVAWLTVPLLAGWRVMIPAGAGGARVQGTRTVSPPGGRTVSSR
jgi:hypothetical protein